MAINPQWDTIVVPAKVDNFNKVFMGEKCWYGISLNPQMVSQLKYIAVYQSAPVSALTHWAEIERIVNSQSPKKWVITFKGAPTEIGPISNKENYYPTGIKGMIIGPRYAAFEKLRNASHFVEVFNE